MSITRENIEKLKTLTADLLKLEKEEVELIKKVSEEAKDNTLEVNLNGLKCQLPVAMALADVLKKYKTSESYEAMSAKYPEMFAKIDEYKAKAKEINEFNLNVMGIEDITLANIVTLIEEMIDLKKTEEVVSPFNNEMI